MKVLLFSFFLFFSTTSYGQLSKFIGTWVTKTRECFLIQDTLNEKTNVESFDIYNKPKGNMLCNEAEDISYNLFLNNNVLSFQKKTTTYYHSDDMKRYWQKDSFNKYEFRILKFNKTTLVVKPISDLAKKFSKNAKELVFTKQEFAINKTLKFEKLFFSTSKCEGEKVCPKYKLYVDSQRVIKLHSEIVYKDDYYMSRDSSLEGFFTGKLDELTYNNFISIFASSSIDSMNVYNSFCCDASQKRLNIYFNGKKEQLVQCGGL